MFSSSSIFDQKRPKLSTFQEILLSDISFESGLLQNHTSPEELELFVQKYQMMGQELPPIIVEKKGENEFQLKFGILSFMGANICQQEKISALILETPKQNQMNSVDLSRFNWNHLNEITRAKAYQWLLEYYQYSITQLSEALKEERSVISNQIRLLQLPQIVQAQISQGKLTKSHGLTLLRLKNEADQLKFAKKIEQNKLTIRELKQRIKQRASSKNKPKEKISIHQISTSSGHIRIPFSSPQELQELLQHLTQICPSKIP